MPGKSEPRLVPVPGKKAWHVYFERRRISTGTKIRAEAEKFLNDFKDELKNPQGKTVSVSDLLDLYLANRKKRQVPGAERLGWAHKPLKDFFGYKPPEIIGEDACLDYTEQRTKAGVSAATIRTELAALKAASKWAMTVQGGNMVSKMPDLIMPPRPPSRERWLTREEAQCLVDACRARHVKLFVLIGLNTAARHRAILGLTWDRVDLGSRLIDFREPGKQQTRKRSVQVPINDTLFSALLEAKESATTPYVIEWSGSRVSSIKHGFAQACARATLEDVTPHTLRRTAVTWMMQKGVSAWDAAGLAGMTVEMVSSEYAKHSPDFLGGAAKALG
jgi:integrase